MQIPRRITAFLLTALMLVSCIHALDSLEKPALRPLAPPDLSSPRATLTSFLQVMKEAHDQWKTDQDVSDTSNIKRRTITGVAQQFFDLQDIAPSVRNNVGRETAVFVKEVHDRVELPPLKDIPDAEMIAAKSADLKRWTIPQTEISLIRIKDGLREGQWVFNAETDERAAEFYARAKLLPYQPGSTEGLYELFVSEPGWMIPKALISSLPEFMKARYGIRYGNQAGWQWCALFLTLALMAGVMALIYRAQKHCSKYKSGAIYYVAIGFPILAMVVPQLATDFLSEQIFITGQLFSSIDFVLDLVSLAAAIIVIQGVTNRLSTAITSSGWFHPNQLNGHLALLTIRVVGVVAMIVTLFEGGRYAGIPVSTLVAGVSVSGLTVALAAQDGMKNLFGSLMIMLDRPFQVGDLIRIKGHEGKVESVGLRSTCIREATGHVITLSNDEMAQSDIENISRRKHLRRTEVLTLREDTPPENIERFVAFVRNLLEHHEAMDPDFPPIVLLGFGKGGVTVTITYFYGSLDEGAFSAFNEKTTLQILGCMAREGIRI